MTVLIGIIALVVIWAAGGLLVWVFIHSARKGRDRAEAERNESR